jgi:hypothetical protein
MTEVEINNHKLKLYKSAEELPVLRYSRFQKYQIIESGIGSNIEAVSNHFAKVFEFFAHSMHEEAFNETKNMFYNFNNLLEGNNIQSMSFACLVHSIDGVPFTDVTESGLEELLVKLDTIGVSQEYCTGYVEEVKKKIGNELQLIAPTFFNDADSYELFGFIKNKIALLAKAAQYEEIPTEIQDRLKEIDAFLAKKNAPDNFDSDDPENVMLTCDTNFEQLCAVLEGNGVSDSRNLTVLQFYVRLEHFRKVAKASQTHKFANNE